MARQISSDLAVKPPNAVNQSPHKLWCAGERGKPSQVSRQSLGRQKDFAVVRFP